MLVWDARRKSLLSKNKKRERLSLNLFASWWSLDGKKDNIRKVVHFIIQVFMIFPCSFSCLHIFSVLSALEVHGESAFEGAGYRKQFWTTLLDGTPPEFLFAFCLICKWWNCSHLWWSKIRLFKYILFSVLCFFVLLFYLCSFVLTHLFLSFSTLCFLPLFFMLFFNLTLQQSKSYSILCTLGIYVWSLCHVFFILCEWIDGNEKRVI